MGSALQPTTRRADALRLCLLLLVGWAARAWYLWIRPIQSISVDAQHWNEVGNLLLAGGNPYALTDHLNWPPFWMQWIYLLARASAITGMRFDLLLSLLLIAFESLLIVAIFRLMRMVAPRSNWFLILLLGMSLDPIPILLVAQHGAFDVIVVLWIVLFLISLLNFLKTRDPIDWLLACFWLGLGVLSKTFPLALAPLLAMRAAGLNRKTRGLGLMLLGGPTILGMSIVYVLSPAQVWQNVIAYHSLPGWYGISGLLRIISADRALELYGPIFAIVVAVLMIVATLIFWRRPIEQPRRVVLLAAMVMLAIPTFGPGYGSQYIWWFLPLMIVSFAAFDSRGWRILLIGVWLITVATYLFEYLFLINTGAAYMMSHGEKDVILFSMNWSDANGTAVARVPMFVANLMLLGMGIFLYFRSAHSAGDDFAE